MQYTPNCVHYMYVSNVSPEVLSQRTHLAGPMRARLLRCTHRNACHVNCHSTPGKGSGNFSLNLVGVLAQAVAQLRDIPPETVFAYLDDCHRASLTPPPGKYACFGDHLICLTRTVRFVSSLSLSLPCTHSTDHVQMYQESFLLQAERQNVGQEPE
jgi:hypothetical protein